MEYFSSVETTEEHNGYFCSVGEALTIVIMGSFCGLRNTNQIHQWAVSDRTKDFLRNHFGIQKIPCYYWLLCLLKIINPESLNRCFINWVYSLIPESLANLTLSFDGKTVCSTCKMNKYNSPLHIVSAHIAELGITFGQQTVYDKSNEIPAVRELLSLLEIEGCMVVADALNCQTKTATAIIDKKADYLLSVKDNQETLKQNIEDYVQDGDLRKTMDTATTLEKNSGRIERRIGFTTHDIDWLYGKEEWAGLTCIGAINTQFTTPKGTTNEWHYYISSRNLTAEELLRHARYEWSVESMHWLLDVHFEEDFCRAEDKNIQQNLNMIRKIVLNSIRYYKNLSGSLLPFSKIMLDCLLHPENLLPILRTGDFEN
jgi:predicted transposase YbfD/YdcC